MDWDYDLLNTLILVSIPTLSILGIWITSTSQTFMTGWMQFSLMLMAVSLLACIAYVRSDRQYKNQQNALAHRQINKPGWKVVWVDIAHRQAGVLAGEKCQPYVITLYRDRDVQRYHTYPTYLEAVQQVGFCRQKGAR